GGKGVARGYLAREELTRERFLADPFRPGETIYRTGDLVRFRPDGVVEYVGRADHQVKIRGFRIELGEIEASLASIPSLKSAVVVARERVAGEKQLVAYCVAADVSAPPTTSDLRRALMTKLPEYIVPSAFVFLAALPMTLNGKVDHRALPAPEND